MPTLLLFLMAFLLSVPPMLPESPASMTVSMSMSDSLTMPQVVLVRGRRAAALGLFLMVPPAGESLSKPSSGPPGLSLRHPELLEDLEDRENDLRRLRPRSRVPTGVL